MSTGKVSRPGPYQIGKGEEMKRVSPIFVFGLLVGVSLSCSNPISDFFPTQTATLWTPTPTGTPTSSPTDTPTDTPVFTPTPEYLFRDEFENPESGWDERDDNYVKCQYSDGGFRMKLKMPNYYAWCFPPTQKDYADIRIDVDAKKIGGPDTTEFGIIARVVDNNNYYIFIVTNDGKGVIIKNEDDKFSGLSGEGYKKINGIVPDGMNHITVHLKGKNLELHVNGALVLSASDSSFKEGRVGLVIGNGDIAGADVLFDNFSVLPA
jgi:hypothetical protein